MKKILISTYFGNIAVRVYDTELKKNVGKIEVWDIVNYLEERLAKGKLKEVEKGKGKGNALSIYKIK